MTEPIILSIIRDFNKDDYNAYAGAMNFQNNCPPLIWEHTFDDPEATLDILGDKNGIEIHFIDEDGNDTIWGRSLYNLSKLKAHGIMRAIVKTLGDIDNTHPADLCYTIDTEIAPRFKMNPMC